MPRELNTIQKVEKLNTVVALDDKGPGNANHEYLIKSKDDDTTYADIKFQKGPRKDSSSVHGVLDTDLLEIVRDRLIGFQSGDFATDDNAATAPLMSRAFIGLAPGAKGTPFWRPSGVAPVLRPYTTFEVMVSKLCVGIAFR